MEVSDAEMLQMAADSADFSSHDKWTMPSQFSIHH